MSVIIDTTDTIEAHRQALAAVFGVPVERIEVRTSVAVDGTTPVLSLDIRLDGERAPEKWWEFTALLIEAARTRAELAATRRRLAAAPWWKRWGARILGWLP